MISQSKFQVIHRQLSGIAQKVYAAVPCETPWAVSYIHSEMQRLGSSTRDVRVVQGCLNSLKDAGLIQETSKGLFVRAQVKPTPIAEPNQKEQPVTQQQTIVKPKTPRNPMAILNELAAKCKALQDEMEMAALEIDEYVTAKDGDAAKLKQLQTLLKSLS